MLRSMKTLYGILLSLLLLALSGCQTTIGDSAKTINGLYGVQKLDDTNFEQTPAYIRVFENGISGEGPVNRWSGQIVDNKVTSIVSTRRAGPEIFMRIETALINALSGSEIKQTRSGDLKCVKDGKTVIVLNKLEAKDQ